MELRKTQSGFTLVELIIVMVILGILAVVAVPRLGSAIGSSEVSAEDAMIGNLRSALEVYAMDQVVLNSSKSYPSHPFDALDGKSVAKLSGNSTGVNGSPWGFDTGSNKIYHQRNDGNFVDWNYNSTTGELY